MTTKVKLIAAGVITPSELTLTTASAGTNTVTPATTAFVQQELTSGLAPKATIASPTFTGTPSAPTAAGNTTTTQLATTAFVQQELTTLIGGAPSTLNDLNELAAAINDDANYNSTLTTALATKAPLAAPALTGTVTAASHVQIAGNLDVVGQIGAYNNPGSSWGAMGLRATDYTFKNSGGATKMTLTSAGKLFVGDTTASNAQLRVKQTTNSEWAANIINHQATAYGLSIDTTSSTALATYNFAAYTPAGTGFFVKNSGNVGIGVTDPDTALHVSGAISLDYGNGNSYQGIKRTSVGNEYYTGTTSTATNEIHTFTGSGSVKKMVILEGGNVGIGKSSPLQPLNVHGRISSNLATADHYYGAWLDGNSTAGQDSLLGVGPWHNDAGYVKFIQSSSPHRLSIYTTNTADHVTFQEAGGNVGIGTTTPKNTLDLGTSSQGRRLTFTNYSNLTSEYSNASLWLSSNFYPNAGATGYKTGATGNFGAAAIRVHGTGGTSNSGVIQFYTDPNSSKTADAAFTPTERMRIDSSGNVGIGDTPGTNNKFRIKGSVIGTAANLAETAQLAILSLNYPRGNVNSGIHFGYANANYIQAADDSGSNAKQLTLNPFGGNVGIGTATPNDILDIRKANSQLRLTDSDDNKFVQFSYSGGKLITRNNSTNTTVNQTTLTEDGKFGIGTISPSSHLQIQTASQSDTGVTQLELTTTVNANPSHINQKFSSGAGWIAMIQAEQRAAGQYGALNFWTANNGNPAQKMSLNYDGDLSVGDTGVQDSPHPLHKKVEVTATAATSNAWSTSSGSNGGYDVSNNDTSVHQNRGSISAAGYYNHHVAHFSLRGNFAANTWYPFTTRTQLQSWIPGAGSSQDTGMPMYFRVYTYDVSGGGGDYLSHRLTDRFWFTGYSSNSNQRHQIPLGPAMGHAPNRGATTDHQDYGNNPIQVSINHRLGTDSYYSASQTFDIWFNQARTGLTGGGALQVEIYAYIG